MEKRLKSDIEAEQRLFESMVNDDCSFAIAVATMPDDFIIRLHDYLLKQGVKQELSPEINHERLERLKYMISKLEDIEVVQKHMEDINQSKEQNKTRVIEIQAVKKIGPFKRLKDNFTKNRK